MTTFTSVIAASAAQPPPTPIPPTPGPSCAVWDAGCQAGQLAQTGFQSLVAEIARGTGEFVVAATTWWTTTPSVDPLDPAVGHAQTRAAAAESGDPGRVDPGPGHPDDDLPQG